MIAGLNVWCLDSGQTAAAAEQRMNIVIFLVAFTNVGTSAAVIIIFFMRLQGTEIMCLYFNGQY